MHTNYNKIGISYNKTRKADLRIFSKIYELLEYPENKSIIDIGAGTGNYANILAEKGNKIFALEPSSVMIQQSIENENVEWINGYAEDIRLEDEKCDYAICILSINNFSDSKKGFNEIFRILKKEGILLIYTYIPEEQDFFWLQDYFPSIFKIDMKRFPSLPILQKLIERCGFKIKSIRKFKIPYDLKDNFLAANWRNPENYLKKEIRDGISTFSLLKEKEIRLGINMLDRDLFNGEWEKNYGDIRSEDYFDSGYRFLLFEKK